MSDTPEIWVRIPRKLFDEIRSGLDDCALDLYSAARLLPDAPYFAGQASHATQLVSDMGAVAVGLAIERTPAA